MKLSTRIRSIVEGGSDGWEVWYRARDLRDAGHDITMLTLGDHDRLTPEVLIEAMAAAARSGHTGYKPMAGMAELRAAVAARVAARSGAACSPEEVIIVPGGQAGLFAALTAVLDQGETCLYFDPGYITYPGTIRAVGGLPLAVPARPENGFQPQRADLDVALDRAKGPVRALLINSPNNPTGAVYSRETIAMLADFAREHDLWLLSDEVYDGQVWEGEHLSPRFLPGMAERVLLINSLSKAQVMTGWRLGWVAGPAEAVARMTDLSISTTYGVPGFIQMAALAAVTRGGALEAELAATYHRRRDIGIRALAGSNAVRVSPPQGAMYLMLDIRATGMSGTDFALALLEAERIAVMPGESFGPSAAGHVRVALTVEDRRLEAALRKLGEFAARAAEAGGPLDARSR